MGTEQFVQALLHPLRLLLAPLIQVVEALVQQEERGIQEHRCQSEKLLARIDLVLERQELVLERQEAIQTDGRVGMRLFREDAQKTLAVLREEVHGLRTDAIAAAERCQPPADPQLPEDCLQWLIKSKGWHTSAGVASGVGAPLDEVRDVLCELVVTSEIDNREQGTSIVYRAFSELEAFILDALSGAESVPCKVLDEPELTKHWPNLDSTLRSLVERGKVRSTGQDYRLVVPIPLEGPRRQRDTVIDE